MPPSAWSTSQSTVTSISGMASRSTTARSDRAMRRWISWSRPDVRRLMRSGLDPGSIEYSAVTQPRPVLRSHGGTPSPSEAVHSTRVRPKETRHEPAAISVKSRWKVIGRSSSSARPSGRLLGSDTVPPGRAVLEVDDRISVGGGLVEVVGPCAGGKVLPSGVAHDEHDGRRLSGR